MDVLAPIVGLVIGVIAVSVLADTIHVPAPIMLVLGGIIVSFIPQANSLKFNPKLVLVVLLPPLLYAASLNSSLLDVRRYWQPIISLSFGLVIATTLGVGILLHLFVPSVSLPAAFALGAVVAPTDAVAAISVARRLGIARRSLTILEGESMFNDATALVSFRIAVAAMTTRVTAWDAVEEFLVASVGGAVIGIGVGFFFSRLRRYIQDSATGTALSLVTPFIAYLPSEAIHASGIIAVVVAGLIVSHRATEDQNARSRLVENATWSSLQFLLEGIVFALIGMQLRHVVTELHSNPGELAIALVVVLGTVILMRPAWIFATNIRKLRHPGPPALNDAIVVSWAGIRGVVSLAAALALPIDTSRRDLLVILAVAVIFATLGGEGLTLPWVIRKFNVRSPDPRLDDLQQATAVEQATQAALRRLDELIEQEHPPDTVVERLRALASLGTDVAWERLGASSSNQSPTTVYQRLRKAMIDEQRAVLMDLRKNDDIDDVVWRRMQRELDFEEAVLGETEHRDTENETLLEELIPSSNQTCPHLAQAPILQPQNTDGCEECLALGWEWVHLRRCIACGHVGCCDSSRGKHATDHWQQTKHPAMQSAEPGESWRWCYEDSVTG